MRHCIVWALLLPAAGPIYPQTQVDLRTQAKSVDFSAAATTRPVKLGATLPPNCAVGELFFLTNAESGKNLYGCAAAGQWKLLGGTGIASGCGLTGCESGICQIDSAVVPSYTAPLAANALIVARDSSTLAAIPGGPAGSILTSNGQQADPTWTPASVWTNHAALTNLDYASSGHTGFQPALGFTPERQLTFSGPLVRTGDAISCPGCGSGGSGGGVTNHALLTNLDYAASGHTGFQPALGFTPERQLTFSGPLVRTGDVISCPGCASYTQAFTAVTSVSLAHGLGTRNLQVECYDQNDLQVEADTVQIAAAAPYAVAVNFAVAQSGRCVVSGR